MGIGKIVRLVFEEKTQVLRRKNEVCLKPNRVDGVKRDQFGWKSIAESASVGRYLPLVVTDYTQLQQLRHCLVERQHLPNAPLRGEGLPRSFIGPGFPAVDFPVSSEICRGPLVSCEIEGSAADQVVAPVTRADIGGGSWRKSSRGGEKAISNPRIDPLKIPTQR